MSVPTVSGSQAADGTRVITTHPTPEGPAACVLPAQTGAAQVTLQVRAQAGGPQPGSGQTPHCGQSHAELMLLQKNAQRSDGL